MKTTIPRSVLFVAVLLCLGHASLGEAAITKTMVIGDKEYEWISAKLGDRVCVKLTVDNGDSNPVLVEDELGSALRYMAGTCELDGIPLTPTISDNTISLLILPGSHEITYEFQVVEVGADNATISSIARVHVPASVETDSVTITLCKYLGFYKWLGCLDYPKYPENPTALPLQENIEFVMNIFVRNHFDFTIKDLEISDDLPAELQVDEYYPEEADVQEKISNGKAQKVRWIWTVGDLGVGDETYLNIYLSTALNPAGKQHFVSPGWYDVAKKIVVKFRDPWTGNELRAYTGSESVYAGP